MLKWCAYCQHFLGEKPPYDSFEMTHGICESCRASQRSQDSAHIMQIQTIAEFYNDIRDKAVAGHDISIPEVIAESKRLGISSVDMAVGILQPILNEMGGLFIQGKVTVAIEHAFTHKVDRMVTDLFVLSTAMKDTHQKSPQVMLTCVDGNYHWLGLRLLELSLLDEGIPARAYIPSLPREEIIRLAVDQRPIVLGISVFDRAQCGEAGLIRDAILQRTQGQYAPRLAVGGNGAKQLLAERAVDQLIEHEIGYFRQSLDFVEFLKSFLVRKVAS
jgi:methanogenic corrinoid protein MtbC1